MVNDSMFQNCIGEDLTCRVRAAVDIAKGAEITTTYTHGLAGTAWRRRHLRKEWTAFQCFTLYKVFHLLR